MPSPATGVPTLWPIELLHPSGEAQSRLLLGSECPASFGSAPLEAPTGQLDVIVLAPGTAECRDPVFLGRAVELVVGRLAADGLGYVLAPPRWRERLWRRLHESDLRLGPAYLHFPAGSPDQYLVPLDGPPLRYTVSDLMSRHPVLRSVVSALLPARMPGMLRRALPLVGIVVRRTAARPMLEWLTRAGVTSSAVVIRTKWRAEGGTAVLHCFPEGDRRPSHVGKLALSAHLSARTESEARALARLSAHAALAGARVPDCTLLRTPAGRPLLMAVRLSGRPAAHLLQRGSVAAVEVLSQLAAWLETWNRSTSAPGVVDQDRLNRELFEPAEHLAPLLRSGAAYLEWLRELGGRVMGSPLPLVAVHEDLTMVNILLQEGAPPAIVDWEMARASGLPLTDFFYAAVDAVTASRRDRGRREAFVRCFVEDTSEAGHVRRLAERVRQASGLPVHVLPMCFHACWLHHAANEVRRTAPDSRRPFLDVLQWLAEHPTEVSF